MSSNQEAVLSFEIVLDATLGPEAKKSIDEIQQAKNQESTITDEANDLLGAEEVDNSALIEEVKTKLMEEFGDPGEGTLLQVGQMAKNPQAFITRVLSSNVTKILGPIAIGIIAAEVGIEVIKLMSVKGGPLNRDWRRFIEQEVGVGLTRAQQKEDEFGVSQTILTQIRGFAPNNENWTHNSLFDVNDARIARIGLSEREAGVTFFVP